MKVPLSNRVSQWTLQPNTALHGKILELQNTGEKILDLTIGISDQPIPEEAKTATIAAITSNYVPYTAVLGDIALRQALQKKLKNQNNLSYELDTIIVTTGAKQAMFQALYVLTNPGDTVAIIKPYWPAYMHVLEMLQLKPFIIDIKDITDSKNIKIKAPVKVLLFDLPHNPTGKVFTKEELEDIVSFAERNNIFIIADESYEKLVYEGKQLSMATLHKKMQNNILTMFSASQSFSMMGWRLGYAVGEKNIISAMEAVQSAITAATPYLAQAAVTAILNADDHYPEKLVEEFKKRRDAVYPDLNTIPWLTCELPASGPYFWCNIEKLTKDSKKFAEKLLERQKIAILPGEPLGAPGWIRIAFNVQSIEVLKKAIKEIRFFGDSYE